MQRYMCGVGREGLWVVFLYLDKGFQNREGFRSLNRRELPADGLCVSYDSCEGDEMTKGRLMEDSGLNVNLKRREMLSGISVPQVCTESDVELEICTEEIKQHPVESQGGFVSVDKTKCKI